MSAITTLIFTLISLSYSTHALSENVYTQGIELTVILIKSFATMNPERARGQLEGK